MTKIKLLVATPKTRDRERAVLPTILYVGQKENWGDVKGFGFGLMIGWWSWGIGFSFVTTKSNELRSK